ncbi:Fpg/Nei family DNA glycosylase [Mobilicoccus caccae]|uniref:Formamidopyrimidine-DNA glycosylase n=1 Tax=Mobilicoccus caccae TaxID=1859295 RepID=A0ABQ6IU65_9MICO|nr:DNA-formamidopyrimidine glycosylase family protein [Mobilicoccus caccae]GMA41484.1 formamidopyrimidine-DNA glycosylase [Mobilicoccus caccae]
MPELPEVQALADFLSARLVQDEPRVVVSVQLGSIAVLKTYDPPPDALAGLPVAGVRRVGKFIDLDCEGTHLVFHLAKAGWLRWSEALSEKPLRPGKSPIALRVRFDDGSGFDLTEAGTRKSLAVYVVDDPQAVPRVASLGPDPLGEDFTLAAFTTILRSKRAQIKGVLRDQGLIAGIGNAYSDEILHVAKLSPFAMTTSLDEATVERLYEALQETLRAAVGAASGKPAAELKDAKRGGMRVHGRTGQECPVCGDVVREVSFADSSLQYCATCQTGGKPLADRRMSRLLK